MHIPVLPDSAPGRGNIVSEGLGRLVLRLAGWEFQGEWPNVSQCVVILAPHTSNWDFVIGLSAALAIRLNARWLGKDSLFRTPLARFFRWQGGIPAVRDHAQGLVGSVVEQFQNSTKLWLALAPEGTRSEVSNWRTGFYHIARSANVPIIPLALDWQNRKVIIFDLFFLTGQIDNDIAKLQDLYRPVKGFSV